MVGLEVERKKSYCLIFKRHSFIFAGWRVLEVDGWW